MKVASRRISHKSEVGGIRFVNSEKEAVENFKELISIRFAEGVNVQPMLEKGLEIFIRSCRGFAIWKLFSLGSWQVLR
uniref:Uncharacterized protein n=1 Tax=Archaeoglobus fulgidus TaxID=2234 RepID=A0A7J3M0G8_ARCFL